MDGSTAIRVLGKKLGRQFVGENVELGVQREDSGNLNLTFMKEGEMVGSCLVVPNAKKAYGFVMAGKEGKRSFEVDLKEFVDLLKNF